MSETIWWTGFVVWTGVVSVLLWALLHLLWAMFDATWFSVRCVIEGATKNLSALNLWRLWSASFMGDIYSARAAAGHIIIFPGYGEPPEIDGRYFD